MSLAHLQQGSQLFPCINVSCRVVGRTKQYSHGLFVDFIFKGIDGWEDKAVGRAACHWTKPYHGYICKGSHVGIIGLRDDKLVIGVAESQEGELKGLGASCGDHNIIEGQIIHAHLLIILKEGLS